MAKVVKKTIISSEVTVSRIVITDGVPALVELEPLVLNKKIASLEHAEREVKKSKQFSEYIENKERLVVSGYENKEDVYTMAQADFMKYGTIENAPVQTELLGE